MRNIDFLIDKGVLVEDSLNLFGDVETYNATIGEFLVGIHHKIKSSSFLREKSRGFLLGSINLLYCF